MDIDRKRTAHEAVARVARAIVEEKTRIIDLDLTAYFDNVQHSLLLEKVARRVQDRVARRLWTIGRYHLIDTPRRFAITAEDESSC